MRAVWYIALKDLRLLWRYKPGLFFVVVFPLIMALFFGAIFSSSGDGASAMKIAVVDEDNTDYSRQFVAALNESQSLTTSAMPLDSAQSLVRRGKLLAYLRINEGFGQSSGFGIAGGSLELGVDPRRKAEVGFLQGMIMEASFKPMQEMFTNPTVAKREIDKTLDQLNQADNLPDNVKAPLIGLMSSLDKFIQTMDTNAAAENSPMSGPDLKIVEIAAQHEGPRSPWEITFPQALLWALIGCAASFGVSIVVERTRGTFLRLRIAPLSRMHILAGKGLACFIACILVMTLLLVFGVIVFGIHISSVGLLLAAMFCSAVCFVGIMMMMSVLGKTEESVGGAGWAILLVFSMTGGGMVPLMVMPSFMLTLSHISPVKWAILAIEGAIWRNFTPAEMALPLGILLSIGIIGFSLGVGILSRADR
ncbi:MAG: ABC transporter permease [Candidatus Zixiibacteriota bacterium]